MSNDDDLLFPRTRLLLNIFGRSIFIIGSGFVIVLMGGGLSFVRKPVGIIYLILWVLWWTTTFLGRQRGDNSTYDFKQRIVVTVSGFISVPFLIIVPSWEYYNFSGPFTRNGFFSWTGLFLFAAGILMQSIAMWQLKGLYTAILGIQPDHHLVKTGLYRFLRHPGYLSYIISIAGIGFSMSSFLTLIFLSFIFVFILWRIRLEEEMLLEAFGDEYRDYMSKTKRLIPFIF